VGLGTRARSDPIVAPEAVVEATCRHAAFRQSVAGTRQLNRVL
jgi:hypothetical protein